jgi:predicted DNA-binding transcriptional regulator AlpA
MTASMLEQLLTAKEVAAALKLSVPTVWRRAREDAAFPKPFSIGPNATRWRATDVQEFIAKCAGAA